MESTSLVFLIAIIFVQQVSSCGSGGGGRRGMGRGSGSGGFGGGQGFNNYGPQMIQESRPQQPEFHQVIPPNHKGM